MEHQTSMSIAESDLERMIFDEAAEPKALPLSLLAEITNGFSDEREIGRGGFAVVYKATLENGDVAVKRLIQSYRYPNGFQREVECLMKSRHKNIVRFLGYCADTQGTVVTYNGRFVIADDEQRLLCFEYLPNGSLDSYISDASCGLEWRIRYRIIKDICEGLLYLHQKNIVHLDLKPANILLDRNMVAKITDFGLSRCFEEDESKIIATTVGGTLGYLAPEFTTHVLTQKLDLYSLGVIIMEMLTGEKGYQDIDNVLESWSNRLEISRDNPVWEQIKVCAEIGMDCTNFNPTKRPDSVKHIIERLVETESDEVIPEVPGAGPRKMLNVHPLELCFPFELNKLIPCSLNLINNEYEHVAFRLIMDDNEQHYDDCFVRQPLYGIVPPRYNYTLVVTAESHHMQVPNTNDLILETAILGNDELVDVFQSAPEEYFIDNVTDDTGMNLHVVKAVLTLPGEIITSSQPNSPEIKMLSTHRPSRSMYSLDTNHDEQWIITGEEHGHVRIWNYRTQKIVDSLKISDAKVTCVKFIARKQWLVAGTDNDLIHVYEYRETKMRKITSFRSSESVHSLIVHPSKPYLLSSHYSEMKLWDWENGWECIKTFDKEHSDTILQVVFNPNDTIASASEDHRVKVWNLNSPASRYTFSEHSDTVNCLDFFTCYGQEYLVTASDDKTAKIWDMQKMLCVRTLEVLSPVMSVVYHPKLHILITGSKDGCICLWSTANTRINNRSPRSGRIVNVGCGGGAVHSLAYLMGSIVIGKENTVTIMNINNNVNNMERTIDDYSEPVSSAYNYTRGPAGDTACELTPGSSSSKLLDVVLDLMHFPCERESISWSLHLTNKACDHVAFRLTDKRSSSIEALAKLPLYGIVPSRSSYSLIVSSTKEELARVMKTNFEPILQSSTSGNNYALLFMNQDECRDFFEEAKEMGKDVHEVAVLLKGDYHVHQSRETNSEPAALIQPRMQITSMTNTDEELCSLDAHPTEPWIITGHANGQVRTWNHGTQGSRHTFKVSERPVSSIKVVARENWIVAATSDGFIHVYNCARMTQIKKIRSIRENDHCSLKSLAVHPTEQYLLSTSMKLWKWNKGWDCIQNFMVAVHQVAFNPNDANCFASVSGQRVIEVWSLASRRSSYTMSGHLGDVNCLEFFTRDDGQYLITGSDDCTAKIWDLYKRECAYTMEAIMSPVISAISLPGRPYLVTGSKHGTVQLWSSIDFTLKRTVNFCGGGPVRGLLCLAGSQRVVIGQKDAVSIIQFDDEETIAIGQNDIVSIMEIVEEEEA